LARIFRGELLCDVRIDTVRPLPAAGIAHQDYVLEARDDGLLGDAFEHLAEQRGRNADITRDLGICPGWAEGQHRQSNRVAELLGDVLYDLAADEIVTADDILRAALLGASDIEQRR